MRYPIDAFYNNSSRILILGLKATKESYVEGFYYANKSNKFWELLSNAFSETKPISQQEKENFLKRHNIAVWDVYQYSNNSNNNPCKMNNVDKIINATNIQFVFCNGEDAFKLFRKYFLNSITKPIIVVLLTQSSNRVINQNARREKEWNAIAYI